MDLEEIWLPGRSSREQGTGLGLTIVRDSVVDMGGTVEAQARGPLGGATFEVRLPVIQAHE
jgi:signal transduction histidine kinase